ncbi:non-canonical purine NTP pyrophosphatase, rdgB/HAM1 family [Aspergillus avenaceus]|uniref:Inosine triphosphate pyrophosphatase n=1 Tax=Aspergillus avenaceus TaxID=36643 RepID=A0A5N6TNT1_ASPAV|nr:non-canonical purine NTP pyrophosphatase, rdgB/HAM1 family [Aspergillus avenaceus]
MTQEKPTLTFITGNKNKAAEVTAILGHTANLRILSIDLPEIQGTVEEITREKCRAASEIVKGSVLVEDSGLEMRALGGLPGAYVKAFVDTVGNEGLVKILAEFEDKSADAVCTFAYSGGVGEEPVLFQGRLEGRIVPARGVSSFGWEPIFEHKGETLAEMDVVKKNGLSHRFRGLEKFRVWFESS